MKVEELVVRVQGKQVPFSGWDEVDFNPREEGFQITLRRTTTKDGKLSLSERKEALTIFYNHQGEEVVRTEYDSGWLATGGVVMSTLPADWRVSE